MSAARPLRRRSLPLGGRRAAPRGRHDGSASLRRARGRRRPGRLDRGRAAGAPGPQGGARGEGAPPALPHRRVAAAGQREAVRRVGPARASSSASACASGASSSSRPTIRTRASSSSPTRGTSRCPTPGRCVARSSTRSCSGNAAACGAQAIEGCRVTPGGSPDADGASAQAAMKDGARRQWRARYLIDATGRDTLLATKLGCKQKNAAHGSCRDLRPLPQRAAARGQARRQHQHLLVRARLVLVHPAGRRHDQRRRGVLAVLPEVARQAAARVLRRHHRARARRCKSGWVTPR